MARLKTHSHVVFCMPLFNSNSILRCTKARCPSRHFRNRDKHQKKYHQSIIKNIVYGDAIVPDIRRDPTTLKFSCPCGLTAHARYTSTNIHFLCRTNPHTTDPSAYPDSEDEFVDHDNAASELNPLIPLRDAMAQEKVDDIGFDIQRVDDVHSFNRDCGEPSVGTHLQVHLPPSQPTAMDIDIDDKMEFCASDEEDLPILEEAIITQDHDTILVANDLANLVNPDLVAVAYAQLRKNGIDVDPEYNLTICIDCGEAYDFQQIYGHRKARHCQTREQHMNLATKEELLRYLISLNADRPRTIPSVPIPPIRTLPVLTAYRCGVSTCSEDRIFSSKKQVSEHCAQFHPTVPSRRRPSRGIQAQKIGQFRGTLRYIEVNATGHSETKSAFLEILHRYKDLSVGIKGPNFQMTKNARAKSEFLAKTRWDTILTDVNLPLLQSKVASPNSQIEQYLCTLKHLVRAYYHKIAGELDFTVSTLVLRYIHSPDPEKDLKKMPFHKPQETETIDRDADFITTFIIFLFRMHHSPIPSFKVVLHPGCVKILTELGTSLESHAKDNDNDDTIIHGIHSLIFSLLSNPSSDFLCDQWEDPFLRFLVAFHLQDDRGTFSRVTLIPPTISKAQWAFRATAAHEIKLRKGEFNGDCFETYKKYVQPFLTEKQPTMFNILREQMTMISTLAHQHPGLPLFSWDALRQNLSVDGRVIPMNKFVKSIHAIIDRIADQLKCVFRSTRYHDILEQIDSRLDPQDPESWFRDHPQEYSVGTSVFNVATNGFQEFRYRLLEGMASDTTFFIRIEGELVVKEANLWEWYGQVDALVKLIFFAIITTWGGGTRGAECGHLQFEIQDNGERHLFVLNGLVTIVTEYVKTRSFHGHGLLIARTIPWQLARLVLLVYGVVFPAASHLATYAFGREAAEMYLSYMFVLSGKLMKSEDFSKVIASETSRYFDISMGLRQYRQTMATIMTNLAHIDFGEIDPEDDDLTEIRHMFGHAPGTGEKHYALQSTDALREISHTSITSSQRISLIWHAALHLQHPKASKIDHSSRSVLGQSTPSDPMKLVPPLANAVETVIKRSNTELREFLSTTFTEYAQGIGSQILRRVGYADRTTASTRRSRGIMVHPHILQAIQSLLPYGVLLSYTIPQQAEAIQSSIMDDHVLIVMPTGSGKSMAFFAAPLLLPDKMFVLITPLVALTNDMSRRLAATSIQGGTWSNHMDPHTTQLVIVSAHQAGTTNFYLWAKTNHSRIHRLFIDEAHHIFTSDNYRNCFQLFSMLTKLGKPLTFLTATIFPHSVPYLCERMEIDASLLTEIRAPTVRPNVKITMTKCQDFESMVAAVEALVSSINLGDEDRGLIFCTTISNCKIVAKLLDIDYYIAKIKDDDEENRTERARLEAQWRQGLLPCHRWIVATLCFGQGIDFNGVRWVIHVEVNCLMNYSQEIGRAGRDGKPAYATLFYTHLPRLTDRATPGDHEGVTLMIDCLQTKICRWLSICKLDSEKHSCAAVGAVWCDNCECISTKPISSVRPGLRFDLETQAGSKLPRSISVESNARQLQKDQSIGEAGLELLQTVLDNISHVGCVDCWFQEKHVDPATLPHTHSYPAFFKAFESAIRSKKMEAPRHWPFCYLCWVPFHAPCLHPPHVKDGVANPERCNYPGILPRLVNFIWQDEDKRKRLSILLKEETTFSHFSTFHNWLVKPSLSARDLPHPHHLIITFYKVYRAITTSS